MSMNIFAVRLMGNEVHWLQVTRFHGSWATLTHRTGSVKGKFIKGISVRSGNSNDDNSYASNNSYDF